MKLWNFVKQGSYSDKYEASLRKKTETVFSNQMINQSRSLMEIPDHQLNSKWNLLTLDKVASIVTLLHLFAVWNVLVNMMPGGGNNMPAREASNFNYRIPPQWGPNMRGYSFRRWVKDVITWTMLTDLQPQQQVPALIARLQGAAQEMA
jgi:hypothetical protein